MFKKGKINVHHFKDYSMAIKLDEVNKILYAYDIKNNVVDENSKEILTAS